MNKMIITVIAEDGGETLVPAEKCAGDSSGKSLLEIVRGAGFPVPAVCGGRGACGKCRVRIIAGKAEPSATCRAYFFGEELDAGYRLACSVHPVSSITVAIPKDAEKEFYAADSFDKRN